MAFVHPQHFVFLLILLPISSIAQNNGTITIGTSLTATDNSTLPWPSPSGDFSMGFCPLNNEKDLFLLCIWFAKIPDKTIVWHARVDNPVPRGSKVELKADRGLVLTDPQEDEYWVSNGIVGSVANGFMSDTGNFVLQDRNFNKLWESFDNLTDTLLPTKIMERGELLSSRQSETNFSKGRFQLQLVFNESGYIYILGNYNQTFPLKQGIPLDSSAEFYYRATFNFDGVFTQYSHPKISNANGSWTPIWSVPENICVANPVLIGSGICGYNSICTLGSDQRPVCTCPKGYSLLNPNDQYSSCKPDFRHGCEEDKLSPEKDVYSFEVLANTNWPKSDYESLIPYTEDQCRKSCMDDCMCAVAVFRDGNRSWKKRQPLSNGRVLGNLHNL